MPPSEWGPNYGIGLVSQWALSETVSQLTVGEIRKRRDAMEAYRSDLSTLMQNAKDQRARQAKTKRPKKEPSPEPEPKQSPAEPEVAEETEHTRAEALLITLGELTGCSIWIARNDRSRAFRGESLGAGCLSKLPNLGLSEEATRRISLIDVIWLVNNVPACAFEVETTTSVYSGLLRMSDLLAVVPLVNMKLFVVAPRDRQDKVMNELRRPTFRKIGLSDYCRFVCLKDLEDLLKRVSSLAGHVRTTVLDTIAVDVPDDLGI
jgi:hypothetical protein